MKHAEVVIAADVGGTTISAGIVGPGGVVHTHRQVPTYARGRESAVIENIVATLMGVRDEAPPGALVRGVGIGVTRLQASVPGS